MDEKADVRRAAQGFEEDERPENVGQDELARVDDRAVDVRLGGEMEDALDAAENAADELLAADIPVDEFMARVAGDVGQVVEIAGLGQRVEVDDPDVRVAG